MGFKSDREFLRNISIGAVGTRQIAAALNEGGFRVIELERYSGSNKIWATKIKRLRVADLLCLKTGLRIEARGKSTLMAAMSHAANNPDRVWDKGLRDDDLIAFTLLVPDGASWKPGGEIALFRVSDMRSTEQHAKPSDRKAASEGSEVRLTWPATIPGNAGEVVEVTPDKIVVRFDESGRRQTYSLQRGSGPRLTAYAQPGDRVGNGDTIIASVMPYKVPPVVPNVDQYDFVADLSSKENETVYVAAKALGFLPEFQNQSIDPLMEVMETHDDGRVQLEAAASLARLGAADGWQYLAAMARNPNGAAEYRMETALILAELATPHATDLLTEIAEDQSNDSELRSAAVWGLANAYGGLSRLIPFIADEDEPTAAHAIAALAKTLDDNHLGQVLQAIGTDNRLASGLVRAVLDSDTDFVTETIGQVQNEPAGPRRSWLLYLLAQAGREKCEQAIQDNCPSLLPELEFFWVYHGENWTNRLDVTDQINFLEQQTARPLS